MKKLLSLFLALALILSLAGCNTSQKASLGGLDTDYIQQDTDNDLGEDLPPDTGDPAPEDEDPVQPETPNEDQQEPEKPEQKPEQQPEQKPQQPEQKPEQQPEQQPEQPDDRPVPEPQPDQTEDPRPEPQPDQTEDPEPEPEPEPTPTLDINGSYTTKEDVALYIHLYNQLPPNFITKSEARQYGWKSGSLERYAQGKCIGGDVFGNREGILPQGYTYYECDIDTLGSYGSRGAKRIVFTYTGLVYYTSDHYKNFTLLYGEP